MAKLPPVSDHMGRHVATLSTEMEILDAIGFLPERRVTGAPVVDKSGSAAS
jgi:predicted transcriptional regulator